MLSYIRTMNVAEGRDGVGREDEPTGSLVTSTRPPEQLLRLPRTSDTSQKAPRCPSFYAMHIAHPLEEGTAAHPSTLAWRSPWTEEPGGLQSTQWQRVGQD